MLVSVAAILAPICPDLPTPSTTTLPRASTASLDQLDRPRKLLAQPIPQALELENFAIEHTFSLFKILHRLIILRRSLRCGKH